MSATDPTAGERGAWNAGVDAAFAGMITRQNAEDVKRRNPHAAGDGTDAKECTCAPCVGLHPDKRCADVHCIHDCEGWITRNVPGPCEHDGLGCRDRTPHDEHTKVGDGRPCCGWPPRCATPAGPDAGDVEPNAVRRIVNAWDCCGTCAGGVLAPLLRKAGDERAEQIAQAIEEYAQEAADDGDRRVEGFLHEAARVARETS